MSPSMDPHLYVHGCAHICVYMTYIYNVCLVAMLKFESSSHGSTLYFGSHDFLYLTWICIVLVSSHIVIHLVNVLKCKRCYRKFVMFANFQPLDLFLGTTPSSIKVLCL